MSAGSARTRLLVLAAPDRATLLARLERLQARLAGAAVAGFDAAATGGASAARQRLAIVGTPETLAHRVALARERLASLKRDRLTIRDQGIYFGCGTAPGRVAFLFPGEGSQRHGMLREARDFLPPLAAWFGALDDASREAGEPAPTGLIHSASNEGQDPQRLFDISYGGQLCTVANLGMYEAVTALGIRPDAVLGHSNGEHAAAMVACMDVAASRERIAAWLRRASRAGVALGAPAAPEHMVAVSAMREGVLDTVIAPLLARHADALFLAMDNCPLQAVIGGRADAVADAAREIAAAGGLCRDLPFGRAYHTPLFARWARMLATQYRDLPLTLPRLPIYSCLTGAPMPDDVDSIRAAMVSQWTAPVRLRAAIERLYADGYRCFVEIGPDDKLTAFVGDTLRGRPHVAVASASAQHPDLAQLQALCATLFAHGVALDTAAARRLGRLAPAPRHSAPAHRVAVVREALQSGQRALLRDARASLARGEAVFRERLRLRIASAPVLLRRRPAEAPGVATFDARLAVDAMPFLADHALGHGATALPVLSFTTSVALAVAAAAEVAGLGASQQPVEVRDAAARSWLELHDGALDLALEARGGSASVAVTLTNPRTTAAAFSATVAWPRCDAPRAETGAEVGVAPRRWSAERFYRDYAFHGPSFRGLRQVTSIGAGHVAAEIVATEVPGQAAIGGAVDPALLDCAGQLVALWVLESQGWPATVGVFPYAARRIVLFGRLPPGSVARARATVRLADGARTEADVDFISGERVVARVEGLAQRVMRLPAAVARRVFRARDAGLEDRAAWRESLAVGGGIFARVVAPQLLGPEALAAWRANPDPAVLIAALAASEEAA